MAVARWFLKVVKWCLTPVVWILCIPLRILHSILRWIDPRVTDNFVPPKKTSPPKVVPTPDVQSLIKQLKNANKDKVVAGNLLVKEKQEANDLKDECSCLREENKILGRRLSKAQKNNSTLMSQAQYERTADNDENAKLHHSIEQLTQNLKENEKDMADQQKTINAYKTEIESYRQKLEEVQKELQSSKKEAEHLQKTEAALTGHQSRIQTLSTENSDLKQQVIKYTTELDNTKKNTLSMKEDMRHKDGKIQELTVKLQTNKQTNQELTEEIASLESELDSTKDSKDKLASMLHGVNDEVVGLGEQIAALECKLKEEGTKMEASEKENQDLKMKLCHLEDQLAETATALRKMETVKDETQRRLSEMMSLRLRDNNPNIVDLSDKFRPTKLAEMMNELYDNHWTDAFTYLENNWHPADGRAFSDVKCVEFLMNILMEVFTFCHSKVLDDWNDSIKKLLWTVDTDDEKELLKKLKDARKKNAFIALPHIQTQCKTLLSTLRSSDDGFIVSQEEQNELQSYIEECVRLSWLMSLQDPPTWLVCEGWTSVVAQTTANTSPTPDSSCQSNNTTISHDVESGNQHKIQNNLETIQENECDNSNVSVNESRGIQSLECDDVENGIKEDNANSAKPDVHSDIADGIKEDNANSAKPDIHSDIADGGRITFVRELYREYTKRGTYIDYIVWPIMYLHENGPLLNKGVAQGIN